MPSAERLITVLTMACLSSNRVYARVIKDKLYQYLLVNNETTIHQQTRRKLITTGNVFSTNRNNNTLNGFSFLSRNFIGGKQVSPNNDNNNKVQSLRKITVQFRLHNL